MARDFHPRAGNYEVKTFGPKPTYHHGYEWDRYLAPVLCTITVALGGCSATATTPNNGVVNTSAPGVQASSVTAPTAQATTTTQTDSCVEDPDPRLGQIPCSCFTDYFHKTRTKPWCTALVDEIFQVSSPGADETANEAEHSRLISRC